jgi:hypothetical protein
METLLIFSYDKHSRKKAKRILEERVEEHARIARYQDRRYDDDRR